MGIRTAQNLLKKVLISKLLFGKWAVCSGEQTLIFNKFISKNFLKQLVELFFGLQSYLSQKFSWNKELCHVDIGGLHTYLSHVDTDGLSSHLPNPGPSKMFPAWVTSNTSSPKGKNLALFLPPFSNAGSHPPLVYSAIASQMLFQHLFCLDPFFHTKIRVYFWNKFYLFWTLLILHILT